MSKELLTQEHADKIREMDAKFQEIRELAKQIESPIVRKLVQACLIPMALLVDYVRTQALRGKP